VQASFGLAIAACTGLAALTRAPMPAWCAAACVTWLAVESLVYPGHRGSLGLAGGVAALAWVGAVGAVQLGRRTR